MQTQKIIIAITGASGVIYGLRFIEILNQYPKVKSFVIISNAGKDVLNIEIPDWKDKLKNIKIYSENDLASPMASGSFLHDGMVIIPCSMASLAAIANGLAHNLIHRAADVCLKEGRKLILVPRETPLNLIHLKNMLNLKQAGATIIPPCPNFYTKPKDILDIVDQIVAKVLDQLGLNHHLITRWGE
ncbi:MAG: UbiX family flavin prenyltransferase [Desulfonauticus sp.]|nr:UbiX family flavin prenyltransferase [Desulfonauticus sp.]